MRGYATMYWMAWLFENNISTWNVEIGSDALSVCKVVQWSLFINNSDGSFLGSDHDALDVVRCFAHVLQLAMDDMGSLDGRLSVEFGRIANLEEDIFHNVTSIWSLELEGLALEQDIIEAPGLGCQYGIKANLSFLYEKSKIDSSRTRISSRPRFS
jgi:hypothetical protein